jgi:tetratricopeptide (TPR) repeat protein
MKEAEESYKEALDIRRQLAKANPATYQQYVATTLNDLAGLYTRTQRMKEAQEAYQEALDIRRQLAKANPATYQPDVAKCLNSLASIDAEINNLTRAQTEVEEALSINRELWKANPEMVGDSLALSLLIDGMVLNAVQRPSSVLCPLLDEAGTVVYDPQLKEKVTDKQAELCGVP